MSQKLFTCRFCLTREGRNVNVFEHCITDDIHVSSWVSIFFGLKITPSDGLTQNICLACLLKVYQTYFFVKKCQESESVLINTFGVKLISTQGADNGSRNDGNFLSLLGGNRTIVEPFQKPRVCTENFFLSSGDGQEMQLGRREALDDCAFKFPKPPTSEKSLFFPPPKDDSMDLTKCGKRLSNGPVGCDASRGVKLKPLSDMMNASYNFSILEDTENIPEKEPENHQDGKVCKSYRDVTAKHLQKVLNLYEMDKSKFCYQSGLKACGRHDFGGYSETFHAARMDSNENAWSRKKIFQKEENVLLKKNDAEGKLETAESSSPEASTPSVTTEENKSAELINFSFMENYASLKDSNKLSDDVSINDPKSCGGTKNRQNIKSDYYLEFIKFMNGNVSDQNSLMDMFEAMHDMNLRVQSVLNQDSLKPDELFQVLQSDESQGEADTTSKDIETCETGLILGDGDNEGASLFACQKKDGHTIVSLPIPKYLGNSQLPAKGCSFSGNIFENKFQPQCKIDGLGGYMNKGEDITRGQSTSGMCFDKILTQCPPLVLKENRSVHGENGKKRSPELKTITQEICDLVIDLEPENTEAYSKKRVGDTPSPNSFWSYHKDLTSSHSSTNEAGFSFLDKASEKNFQSHSKPNDLDSPVNNSKNISEAHPTSSMGCDKILNQPTEQRARPLMFKGKGTVNRENISPKSEGTTKESCIPIVDLEPERTEPDQLPKSEVICKPWPRDNFITKKKTAFSMGCDEILSKPKKQRSQLVLKGNGPTHGKKWKKRSPKLKATSQEKCYLFVDLEPKNKTPYQLPKIKTCMTANKAKVISGNLEKEKKEVSTPHVKMPQENSVHPQKNSGNSSRKRKQSQPSERAKCQNKKPDLRGKSIKSNDAPTESVLFSCCLCPKSFSSSAELVQHVLHCSNCSHKNYLSGSPQFIEISNEPKKSILLSGRSQRDELHIYEVDGNSCRSTRHLMGNDKSSLIDSNGSKKVSSQNSNVIANNFTADSDQSPIPPSDSINSENNIFGKHLIDSVTVKRNSFTNQVQMPEKIEDHSDSSPNDKIEFIPLSKPVKTLEMSDEMKSTSKQNLVQVEEGKMNGSTPFSEKPHVNDLVNPKFKKDKDQSLKNTKTSYDEISCTNKDMLPTEKNVQLSGGSNGTSNPSTVTSKSCKNSKKKKVNSFFNVHSKKSIKNTKGSAQLPKNSGLDSVNPKRKKVHAITAIASSSTRTQKRKQRRKFKSTTSIPFAPYYAPSFPCPKCSLTFLTEELVSRHMLTHAEHCTEKVQPNVPILPSESLGSQPLDERFPFNKSQSSCESYEPIDMYIMGAVSDEKVGELRHIIKRQLAVTGYALTACEAKRFRCPVCFNLFFNLCEVTSHIVSKHSNLSNEWPMSLLFSPEIFKKLNENPVNGLRHEGPILPQIPMETGLLQSSSKCDHCKLQFSSKSALLKHSIWAHAPSGYS